MSASIAVEYLALLDCLMLLLVSGVGRRGPSLPNCPCTEFWLEIGLFASQIGFVAYDFFILYCCMSTLGYMGTGPQIVARPQIFISNRRIDLIM